MGNRKRFLRRLVAFLAKLPHPHTINGHGNVIELHATIGIESLLVIEHNVHNLHHKAYEPKPQAGLILQKNVGQSEDGGSDVEPMGNEIVLH